MGFQLDRKLGSLSPGDLEELLEWAIAAGDDGKSMFARIYLDDLGHRSSGLVCGQVFVARELRQELGEHDGTVTTKDTKDKSYKADPLGQLP